MRPAHGHDFQPFSQMGFLTDETPDKARLILASISPSKLLIRTPITKNLRPMNDDAKSAGWGTITSDPLDEHPFIPHARQQHTNFGKDTVRIESVSPRSNSYVALMLWPELRPDSSERASAKSKHSVPNTTHRPRLRKSVAFHHSMNCFLDAEVGAPGFRVERFHFLKGNLMAEYIVIAHNVKFDSLWLRVKCGVKLGRVFCTLTAARLLVAGTRPGNDLDRCLERYLGIAPCDDLAGSDWGGMFLTDEQLAYAGRDVRHLHALRAKLIAETASAALDAVTQLEMQLLPVVVEMEAAGLAVDRAKLDAIRAAGVAESSVRAAELRLALNVPTLNVSSPQQLQAALQRADV